MKPITFVTVLLDHEARLKRLEKRAGIELAPLNERLREKSKNRKKRK